VYRFSLTRKAITSDVRISYKPSLNGSLFKVDMYSGEYVRCNFDASFISCLASNVLVLLTSSPRVSGLIISSLYII
jgi:hypothetical protein